MPGAGAAARPFGAFGVSHASVMRSVATAGSFSTTTVAPQVTWPTENVTVSAPSSVASARAATATFVFADRCASCAGTVSSLQSALPVSA